MSSCQLPCMSEKQILTGAHLFRSMRDLHTKEPPSLYKRSDDVLSLFYMFEQVFCEEIANKSGGYHRRFLAATYTAFWSRFLKHPQNDRHFYEVGPMQGCSLLQSSQPWITYNCPVQNAMQHSNGATPKLALPPAERAAQSEI